MARCSTSTPPSRVAARRSARQADRLSELWRAKQLEYTWVRSLMNSYRDFAVITADALTFAAQKVGGLSPELQAKLFDTYQHLDAFADVRRTL